jgi:hypothetical protein
MHISNIKKATILITLLFASYAHADIVAPTECPTPEQIRFKSLQELATFNPDHWIFSSLKCNDKHVCHFNLSNPVYTADRTSWEFYMDVKADSVSDAKKLVESAVDELVYQSGPSPVTDKLYACKYTSIDGVIAARAVYY